MPTPAAYICTSILFGSFFIWYYYCVRIVNRFQWQESSIMWGKSDMPNYRKENFATEVNMNSSRKLDLADEYGRGYLSTKQMKWGFVETWTRAYYVQQGKQLLSFNNQQDCENSASSMKCNFFHRSFTKYLDTNIPNSQISFISSSYITKIDR